MYGVGQSVSDIIALHAKSHFHVVSDAFSYTTTYGQGPPNCPFVEITLPQVAILLSLLRQNEMPAKLKDDD